MVIDKEKMMGLVEFIYEIKRICNNSHCKDCIFHVEDNCAFFSRPWDWPVGQIEEIIEDELYKRRDENE